MPLPVELSLNLRLSFKVGRNKHAEYFKDSLIAPGPFLARSFSFLSYTLGVSESNFPLSELAPAPQETKPTWRGWIHTGVLPFVVLGGVILLIFAEGCSPRLQPQFILEALSCFLETPLCITVSTGDQ